MITIELILAGRTEKYTARGVNLRTSYTAYELFREYELAGGVYSTELLERCEEFIVACFGGAFTREQLLEGYRGSAFRLYPGMLNAVVSYSNEQIVNFPDPEGPTGPGLPETTA